MAFDAAPTLMPLLTAFAGAALVTGAATPLVARAATRLGVVDQPGGRRVHGAPTPRLGGVAVALGLGVGAITYGLVFGPAALLAILTRDQLLAFLLPCLLVFLVGLTDDVRGLSPASRVAVEAVAATFLVQGGYVIDHVANPFGEPISLGLFAIPVTVMWLVGVTNAFNLIDGLDGLLGSVALAALVGVAAVAWLGDRGASGLLAAALAGSVLGFLVWNWHPAKIFMGDSGSLLIGFAIAGLSIKVARNTVGSGTLALHVPLLLCGLPIAETLLTLARRHINGQPYFSGDRSHIHHVLLNKGLAVPAAVRSLALVAGSLAFVAVLSRNWREQAFFAGAVVVFVLAVAALRWLGYLELQVLAVRLSRALRHPRRTDLAHAVRIAAAGAAIERAATLDEIRSAVRQVALDGRFSLLVVEFGLPDDAWRFPGPSDEDLGHVTIEVPLTLGEEALGRLVCQRPIGRGPSEQEVLDHVATPLARRLASVRLYGAASARGS